MSIDHDGIEPLYLQLASLLRRQIRSGELLAGRAIPSEQRLMQMHELGRDTVRAGIAVLKKEGWLVTQRGRGTFVKPAEQWPDEDAAPSGENR
ncbi:winged helix-turn-helix domain-containing protein [Nonomuraea sp. NPDC050404]|uniref:winged helix-turn-helix domain-containing protein n=1 Tax=Nonomuraea sp. NPDC050404 TaxID=3155783 RepID=UPI0033E331BE